MKEKKRKKSNKNKREKAVIQRTKRSLEITKMLCGIFFFTLNLLKSRLVFGEVFLKVIPLSKINK